MERPDYAGVVARMRELGLLDEGEPPRVPAAPPPVPMSLRERLRYFPGSLLSDEELAV